MKIQINTTTEIDLSQIKEVISENETIELIEHADYLYDADFRRKVLSALGMDESDHLGEISDSYMNTYIKDNIGYYKPTIKMRNEIDRLKMQLEATQDTEIKLPDHPHKVKEFFCDLLGLGYHTSSDNILQTLKIKM